MHEKRSCNRRDIHFNYRLNLKVRVHLPSADTADERTPDSGGETATRRQCKIIDAWMAWQSREMVTTIERRAHEAETSALATGSQPVSARPASFLRETSPGVSTSGGHATGVGIPDGFRASSLIQMWKELEADAGAFPSPTAVVPVGVPLGIDDVFECDSGRYSSGFSPAPEVVEKTRVGNSVRMLSSGSGKQSPGEQSMVSSCQVESDGRPCLRTRKRCEMEDIIRKMQNERVKELALLPDRRPVSKVPPPRKDSGSSMSNSNFILVRTN